MSLQHYGKDPSKVITLFKLKYLESTARHCSQLSLALEGFLGALDTQLWALLIINILNFQKSNEQNRFQKHWESLPTRPCLKVRWIDPLINQWRGPDPLLKQGQGYEFVFPGGKHLYGYLLIT